MPKGTQARFVGIRHNHNHWRSANSRWHGNRQTDTHTHTHTHTMTTVTLAHAPRVNNRLLCECKNNLFAISPLQVDMVPSS